MAIDLSALFGQQPDYSAFLPNAEQDRMRANATQQALLNAAISALSMTGRTREPISTGQVLAGALGAGAEGYNQAFDRTLKQMVTGMQLEEYKRKRDAQQRYQELVKGATTQVPQPIPMATGQGSQLEMLSRPEFGGGMADTETVAALKGNLPTKPQIDLAKLQPAVMQYLAETSPEKFIEAQASIAKAGKKTYKQLDLGNSYGFLDEDTLSIVKTVPKEKDVKQFSAEDDKLRTSFLGQAKPYIEISQAYRKIVSAPDTAPGDMSKIFGYMKVLDPGSTVREGEYASAENARGIPEAIRAQYNKVVEGTRLTADQRNKFDQAAGALVNSQKAQFETLKTFYSDAAIRQNANPQNIIYDPFKDLDIKLPAETEKPKPKPKAADLGIPSAKGIKFLGFEPTPTAGR